MYGFLWIASVPATTSGREHGLQSSEVHANELCSTESKKDKANPLKKGGQPDLH